MSFTNHFWWSRVCSQSVMLCDILDQCERSRKKKQYGNHVMHINLQTCNKRWGHCALFLLNKDGRFDNYYFTLEGFLNPLAPKLGPFFHFWRHHFWPKLASSMVNFCRWKRSFQWCLGQSDQPYGAWVKKSEQNFLPLHMASPWSSLNNVFLEVFFNCKQAQQKANHCSKKKRGKKKKKKKFAKIENPKDVGHFLVQKLKILISAHARAKMWQEGQTALLQMPFQPY